MYLVHHLTLQKRGQGVYFHYYAYRRSNVNGEPNTFVKNVIYSQDISPKISRRKYSIWTNKFAKRGSKENLWNVH
jgi:hypothetical protein